MKPEMHVTASLDKKSRNPLKQLNTKARTPFDIINVNASRADLQNDLP